MRSLVGTAAVLAIAASLMTAGIWAWQNALDLTLDWQTPNPDLSVWAIRSAAVALAALGEALALHFSLGGVYRLRGLEQAVRLVLGATSVVAAAVAVALGLAAR